MEERKSIKRLLFLRKFANLSLFFLLAYPSFGWATDYQFRPQSPNYYERLGLKVGASSEEIRAAHRAAAKAFHPDHNASPTAGADFNAIHVAYEALLKGPTGAPAPTVTAPAARPAPQRSSPSSIFTRPEFFDLIAEIRSTFRDPPSRDEIRQLRLRLLDFHWIIRADLSGEHPQFQQADLELMEELNMRLENIYGPLSIPEIKVKSSPLEACSRFIRNIFHRFF